MWSVLCSDSLLTLLKGITGKVHSRTGHEDRETGSTYSSNLSLTSALDRGVWSTPLPGRSTSEKEKWHPLYRRLGGHKGRSGWVRVISPPPGFEPRTVQPVASRYTDCAIPSHKQHNSVQYSTSHFLPLMWKRTHAEMCTSVSTPSRMRWPCCLYIKQIIKIFVLCSQSELKCVN
jgi:hypothetical protein